MESIEAYCDLGGNTEIVLYDWPDSDIKDLSPQDSEGAEGLPLVRGMCTNTNCMYADRCSQFVEFSRKPFPSYVGKAIIYNVFWIRRCNIRTR